MASGNDIYTKRAIVSDSEEHVLLDSLGGKLKVVGLIDHATNATFGHTIDASLSESILPIRVMLDARSGSGQPPPKYRRATTDDGQQYNLLPGGKPELGAPKVDFSPQPGSVKIEGRARNLAELRRLTKRKLDQLGVPFEKLEQAAEHVEEHVPQLQLELVFEPEARRSIAKMACNLLANEDRALFEEPGFDAIRSFVLHGGDADKFVLPNTSPVDIGKHRRDIGPLDHLLLVRCRKDSGNVEGLVVLFGHLQFCVGLGRPSVHRPLAASYRLDQLSGNGRLNDRRDLGLSVRDFSKQSKCSHAHRLNLVARGIRRIFRYVMNRQEGEFLEHMITRTMEETLGPPDGSIITPEKIDALSNLLAVRFIRYLEHKGMLDSVISRLEAQGKLAE